MTRTAWTCPRYPIPATEQETPVSHTNPGGIEDLAKDVLGDSYQDWTGGQK